MGTGKSLLLPYIAGSPPRGSTEEVARATWDEFYKIEQALIGLDAPVALSLSATENVNATTGIVYETFYDEGITYQWEQPPGYFTLATGVWTCPGEGLYQLSNTFDVPAAPSASIKDYIIYVRNTLTPLIGAPVIRNSSAGGLDTFQLRFNALSLVPLLKGTTVKMEVAVYREAGAVTVSVTGNLGIYRVSGLGGAQ